MIDIASETWAQIKARAEERIRQATDRLIDFHLDERHTSFARGEIQAYRDILSLVEARKVEPPAPANANQRTDRSGY